MSAKQNTATHDDKGKYTFLPGLVLRAPCFSFQQYDTERLSGVLQEAQFRDALWLASPDFFRILANKAFQFEGLSVKEKHTLSKYYNRMCFRPTPFGAFATLTVLNWGGNGRVELAPDENTLLHLQPDQQLSWAIQAVQAGPEQSDEYLVNPLLYEVGKQLRLIRSAPGPQGKLVFTLDTLPAGPFYTDLFIFFDDGKKSRSSLAGWIREWAACTIEEAEEQIVFLHQSQILLGPDKLPVIYPKGYRYPFMDEVNMGSFWQRINRPSQGCAVPLSNRAEQLKALLSDQAAHDVSQSFYAAAERPLLQGGPAVSDQLELEQALALLRKLALPAFPLALKHYSDAFAKRFDRQRIPLLQALDPDAGIAYDDMVTDSRRDQGPLQDIRFNPAETADKSVLWTPVHRLLMQAWNKSAAIDQYAPLDLTAKDLEGFTGDNLHFPSSMPVMFRKTEEYIMLEQAGGVSATALAGRFSVFSDAITDQCHEIARHESAVDHEVLFADIAHLSDTHVDNINRRRQIYPYQIALHTFPEGDPETILYPEDLVLSLQNGDLVLESIRHCKRVVPRLATAYNHRNSELAIFRFLCDLQYQGLCTSLDLDLERLFPGMNFYPRVIIGGVVVSPAKWTLLAAEVGIEILADIRRFRAKHHLPRMISMGHYDQQLVFDLLQPAEAAFFVQHAKGLGNLTIYEFLAPNKDIRVGYQALNGQYLGYLFHNEPFYRKADPVPIESEGQLKRNYPLGSEWLYLKIFCTPVTADRLLRDVITPVLRHFRAVIKKWFFIRYTEDGYHLRLRIMLDHAEQGQLMHALSAQLQQAGQDALISDMVGDTYRRELERYGPELIDEVESLFCKGSDLIVKAIDGPLSPFHLAWLSALRLVEAFLKDETLILSYAESVTEMFLTEFKADKAMRVDLDAKFRELRSGLEQLAEEVGDSCWADELTDLARQINFIASRPAAHKKGHLLMDLVHMQLNRTFSNDQRRQELLVWYCLYKYLRSLKGRRSRQLL